MRLIRCTLLLIFALTTTGIQAEQQRPPPPKYAPPPTPPERRKQLIVRSVCVGTACVAGIVSLRWDTVKEQIERLLPRKQVQVAVVGFAVFALLVSLVGEAVLQFLKLVLLPFSKTTESSKTETLDSVTVVTPPKLGATEDSAKPPPPSPVLPSPQPQPSPAVETTKEQPSRPPSNTNEMRFSAKTGATATEPMKKKTQKKKNAQTKTDSAPSRLGRQKVVKDNLFRRVDFSVPDVDPPKAEKKKRAYHRLFFWRKRVHPVMDQEPRAPAWTEIHQKKQNYVEDYGL